MSIGCPAEGTPRSPFDFAIGIILPPGLAGESRDGGDNLNTRRASPAAKWAF